MKLSNIVRANALSNFFHEGEARARFAENTPHFWSGKFFPAKSIKYPDHQLAMSIPYLLPMLLDVDTKIKDAIHMGEVRDTESGNTFQVTDELVKAKIILEKTFEDAVKALMKRGFEFFHCNPSLILYFGGQGPAIELSVGCSINDNDKFLKYIKELKALGDL